MERKLKGKATKNKIVKIIALTIMIFSTSAAATSIWIDSVDLIPEQPLETDIIMFNISGTSGYPAQVASEHFSKIGTSLQLDLYIDLAVFPVVSNWAHSTEILPLTIDAYTLEVRAFDNYSGILQDTYNLDFTVVPEPVTFALFGLGILIVRPLLRRKR
jgi:hypothetical protein